MHPLCTITYNVHYTSTGAHEEDALVHVISPLQALRVHITIITTCAVMCTLGALVHLGCSTSQEWSGRVPHYDPLITPSKPGPGNSVAPILVQKGVNNDVITSY
jgi:hypothetical protein